MTDEKLKPFVGPFKFAHGKVWMPSAKGGDVFVLDIRGWGYLTGSGSGALGLDDEVAAPLQDEFGRMVADALNAWNRRLQGWRTDWENAPKDGFICAYGYYRNSDTSRWEKIRWSTDINGWVDEEGYPFIAMSYQIITPPTPVAESGE